MVDVFVSYSREDKEKVRIIAEELQRAGLRVWWDPHIKTGAGFREEITQNLTAARVVVVVWSRTSVASRFVCDEADEGAQYDRLYPALVDLVDIPLGFRQIQTHDLTRWHGSRNDKSLKEFIATVAEGAKSSAPRRPTPAPPPERPAEPAPKPKRKPAPAQRKSRHAAAPKRRYTVTGRNIRLALVFRSLLMAALITAGFGALAYTSDFVFPSLRPVLIGAVFLLTFFSRYVSFLADKAMGGAASLKLLSGSFLTLLFFGALFIAPIITEGRIYASALEEVKVEGIEGADINSVAISGDGRLMVTSSDDSQARLWSVDTGVGLGVFPNHENWVWHADFSPDGEEVVTASRDLTARVWSVAGQKERLVLDGHRATVYVAKFSPDGETIATGSGDGDIRVFNAESGELLGTMSGHSDDVRSLAFSPDGRYLASASADGTVRLWNALSRRFIRIVGRADPWNEVAWDEAGTRLAAAGDNGSVIVWNPSGTRLMQTSVPGKAFGLAFTRKDSQLAVGSIDSLVHILDARSGDELLTLAGHEDAVRDVTARPGEPILISASRDNTARVWSAVSGEEEQIVGHIESAVKLPVPIDLPPVAMASRAPTPMDFAENRQDTPFLIGKGFATAVALLMTGLLLKALFSVTPLRKMARLMIPALTGLGVVYYLALMLSALPVEASMLWGTLLFVPAAVFALFRWLLAVSLFKR
ncbi:toll/interleukin-1 receptor domain-containing protein [Parvularcula lutaonensis]|uniref:Toll/interleukin-1 receptor domain-containing protein n=1 Tax=Parvularcula lutaonensis TaxID=491923 RepID=A0ABV7MH80_9PROT|nr:TIR domain-containing protein [Parvularcula lutaonensis]GGY53931.1 hypothetical protein GCM10007148_24160 [Parvularcula lutaonensis]